MSTVIDGPDERERRPAHGREKQPTLNNSGRGDAVVALSYRFPRFRDSLAATFITSFITFGPYLKLPAHGDKTLSASISL